MRFLCNFYVRNLSGLSLHFLCTFFGSSLNALQVLSESYGRRLELLPIYALSLHNLFAKTALFHRTLGTDQ